MNRIFMALLAIPLLAGGPALAGDDGSTGDYRYADAWKRKGTSAQKLARMRADTDTCRVRAGYPDDVHIMRKMSRDPAYLGCMQGHGWRFVVYTPRHRSYAGRTHQPASSGGSPLDNNSGPSVNNNDAAAYQQQNDASQAQFNQSINDSQQFMNYMNEQTPHE